MGFGPSGVVGAGWISVAGAPPVTRGLRLRPAVAVPISCDPDVNIYCTTLQLVSRLFVCIILIGLIVEGTASESLEKGI